MRFVFLTLLILTNFSSLLHAQVGAEEAAKIITQEMKDAPHAPVFIIQGNEQKIDGQKVLQELKDSGVKNTQLKEDPPKLIYFLEVRSQKKLNISRRPLSYDTWMASLYPGQIIMVEDTAPGYLDKLRLERKGLGSFKPIKVYGPDNAGTAKPLESPAYIYDDYLSAYTVNPFEQPLTMSPIVTIDNPVVTVYSKPGRWTQKDCASKNLCVGWLDPYASIYLLETRFVYHDKYPAQERGELFYYVGFEYKMPTGETKRGVGWVDSKQLQRKIEYIPAQLQASRMPSMADFEMPNAEGDGLFVFGQNSENPERLNRFTKNMTQRKARELSSIWNIDIAWDMAASYETNNINHSWLPQQLNLTGPAVTGFASVPIFLDLLIKASVKVTVPATSSDTAKRPILFKGEQWLQFATPLMISDSPLQVGLGGYYFTMLNTTSDYGVNSLLGIQLKLLYESEAMWAYLKYAPVGNDLQVKGSNSDFGAGLGMKLEGNSWFKNWGVYGEYSTLKYESPSKNKTTIQNIGLGIMIYF